MTFEGDVKIVVKALNNNVLGHFYLKFFIDKIKDKCKEIEVIYFSWVSRYYNEVVNLLAVCK